jgi:hypothetical protein
MTMTKAEAAKERKRLKKLAADLLAEYQANVRRIDDELASLPQFGKGRPEGTASKSPQAKASRAATIAAFSMIQKYIYIQKKRGAKKIVVPDDVKKKIAEAARKRHPKAREKTIISNIKRLLKNPERPVGVGGGYLYRVLDKDIRDRNDNYLDAFND